MPPIRVQAEDMVVFYIVLIWRSSPGSMISTKLSRSPLNEEAPVYESIVHGLVGIVGWACHRGLFIGLKNL
jgi:hypothetical protein